MATLYYEPWTPGSHAAMRRQMARTLRQYRGMGMRFITVMQGRMWRFGGYYLDLIPMPGLRGLELTSSQDCALCGEPMPAGQSCVCFDNHCQ